MLLGAWGRGGRGGAGGNHARQGCVLTLHPRDAPQFPVLERTGANDIYNVTRNP